jgi:colanic acid biosynthesis glycosyl transferase WcaI
MPENILLLNQVFYPDGAATAQHTTDLALFLKAQGYEVTVITGKRDYNQRSIRYPSRETYRGIRVFRVGSTGFGKRNFLSRLIDSITFEFALLIRLLFTPRYDVVLAFTSPPLIGFIAALYCFFKGGKLVHWLMDINPEAAIAVGYLKPGSLLTKFVNQVFTFSIRRSDRIVVLDRWMKDKIQGHGIDPNRVVVVPPWPVQPMVTGENFKEKNPFRETFKLEGKFVILYSGNHSIVHPLNTLLAAAVRLKQDPDIKFVFIGGGLRVADVTETVMKNELNNVIQLPHQPREMLDASLNLANLHVVVMGNSVSGLVHTSKIYGILATGAPYVAISPRGSHLVDLIDQSSNGFHVEHGDVDALVTTIRRAQQLTTAELSDIERMNQSLVRDRFTSEISLRLFAEQVLGVSNRVSFPIPSAKPFPEQTPSH